MTRSKVLVLRELDYVLAARVSGRKQGAIMVRHILPNVMASAIILAALQVGVTILAESALSFIRIGRPAADRHLGPYAGRRSAVYRQRLVDDDFSGIAITITVLGVVFLGDWLRDF